MAKLTVGMATYDDFDSLWFTLRSLLIHHREVADELELLVVDNNPQSSQGELNRKYCKSIGAEYVPFGEGQGTAQPREQVFAHARTPYVMCMDSHVLLEPGTLRRLLDYYAEHPDSSDLLMGPIVGDNLEPLGTYQYLEWRSYAYGRWMGRKQRELHNDRRGERPDDPPFEIPQQGMGVFSCRKEAWVGFHPDFRGFGGCETYVMEKFRQRGNKVLCLPFLRWHHKFQRPHGAGYENDLLQRYRNYRLGFESLGLSTDELDEHFQEVLRNAAVQTVQAPGENSASVNARSNSNGSQQASSSSQAGVNPAASRSSTTSRTARQQSCPHKEITMAAFVRRHEDGRGHTDFVAEVPVTCARCGAEFRMNGGPIKFLIEPQS